MPRLTVAMVARLQGFPDDWKISGRKTAAYRQIGNAFPPPVAEAVATSIKKGSRAGTSSTWFPRQRQPSRETGCSRSWWKLRVLRELPAMRVIPL